MIIGISGKIGSGKDLIGKIIQCLTNQPTCLDNIENLNEETINMKIWDAPNFEIKRFADTLKDMVCLLLGCTREQLEDKKFKEKELGEEWSYIDTGGDNVEIYDSNRIYTSFEMSHLEHLTPRKLLQLLGTECGREIIHPNIWVNALFSKYVSKDDWFIMKTNYNREEYLLKNGRDALYKNLNEEYITNSIGWIITDVRFPNELKAIEDRNGITIRVERGTTNTLGNLHLSETSLDDATFDYVIDNNTTINDLVEKVKLILKNENLI